jgi:hypothetical protein
LPLELLLPLYCVCLQGRWRQAPAAGGPHLLLLWLLIQQRNQEQPGPPAPLEAELLLGPVLLLTP